ncbi:hypothetical protein TPHA_0K00570 [Tetrapisispora phaffii CBS 4417]|uniref:AP-1 complex subunit gamma n=1 Tax=Tetrapisispora phaffii (strain ATCC 24235 / CBS 4417 / NBRC 1672 / NRRL Y-8282 / UCD 70-5) TaxID=1071381 RepID=G8BZ63_TETPH|nr:hypothetical protein TPHA_0K00570 [Tetrapisispora phaffii CBS 4417]CCE65191.1 hypothetical protein TPHA_0K00570 [Tetrapisispora phaffii CBS 4417]
MGSSLKSFIKDVRGAKTLSEERSIIQKQSAKVRTKLRDDHLSLEKRRKNIQKLMYLFILGEKTHFGQVECINLIASDEFVNKRLGYLAAVLLLDESQDLLTLLTNLMSNDLNHSNKYIVSLALTTLGFLSSPELVRDLYPDVNNILKTSKNVFLVKKALQCTAKMISKDITLFDVFSLDTIKDILNNNSLVCHGTLLGVGKVIQAYVKGFPAYLEMLKSDNTNIEAMEQILVADISEIIPEIILQLKNLNMKNTKPEYDVKGVCDPFLQAELIQTLKVIFQLENTAINDQFLNKFEDLLTFIATNTDPSKSSGQSILYETAKTIFSLNLEQSLRVLGINILANFLNGKNNNIKYVALNTLLQVIPQDPSAVQRHRKYILKCLFDPDVSIKSRALELTFAILDESNIVESITELVNFLEYSSEDNTDLNIYIVEHLVNAFDTIKVSDEKWKLDIFLKILELTGSYMTQERINDILITLNNVTNFDNKNHFVVKLLNISLKKYEEANKSVDLFSDNFAWKLVTVWCIGEYADLVLSKSKSSIISETNLTKYLVDLDTYCTAADTKILDYLLTATLKLSSKITNGKAIEDLRQIILTHTKDANLLIQMKSVQYELIFSQPVAIKKPILEIMPKFEKKQKPIFESIHRASSVIKKTEKPRSNNDLLLDLLGDDTIGDNSNARKPTNSDNSPQGNADKDLLADIFGSSNNRSESVSQTHIESVSKDHNTNSVQLPSDAAEIYDDDNITIYGQVNSIETRLAQIELYFKSKGNITELLSLCAVTKTQKLVMGTLIPSSDINTGNISKQSLKITGSGKLKLRVKLEFKIDGVDHSELFDHKFDHSI